MNQWEWGKVEAHEGFLHRVQSASGAYWCETVDLVLESSHKADLLLMESRVWGLWLDGRFYPGRIDGIQGMLRHVAFDDGDSMWLEAKDLFVMAVASGRLEVGQRALAPRWDGDYEWSMLEQEEGGRFRVSFGDGEEAWVESGELESPPPNPFLDPS